jgi:hypothetical protein
MRPQSHRWLNSSTTLPPVQNACLETIWSAIIGCSILCEAILREGIFGMGRLHPLQGVVVKCGAGGELARKDCPGTSTPQLPQGAEDCP